MEDEKESAIIDALHALLTYNQHVGPRISSALDKFERAFQLGAHTPKAPGESENES